MSRVDRRGVGPGSGVRAAGAVAHEAGIKQPREKIAVVPSENLLIIAAHQGFVLLQFHVGILASRFQAGKMLLRQGLAGQRRGEHNAI